MSVRCQPPVLPGHTTPFAGALPTRGISPARAKPGHPLPGYADYARAKPGLPLPGNARFARAKPAGALPAFARFAGARRQSGSPLPTSKPGHSWLYARALPGYAHLSRALPGLRIDRAEVFAGTGKHWQSFAQRCSRRKSAEPANPYPPLPEVARGVEGGPPLHPLQQPRQRP
jgi:hypothetical protein